MVLLHFQSENDKHLLQETSLAYYFRLYIVTVFLERPADVFGGYNVVGSGGGAGVRRRVERWILSQHQTLNRIAEIRLKPMLGSQNERILSGCCMC